MPAELPVLSEILPNSVPVEVIAPDVWSEPDPDSLKPNRRFSSEPYLESLPFHRLHKAYRCYRGPDGKRIKHAKLYPE